MKAKTLPSSKTIAEAWAFRRVRAVELHIMGWNACHIAEALNVTRGSVGQWLKLYHNEGIDGLLKKKGVNGSRLSAEQLKRLAAMLARSPKSFGFAETVWTRPLVRELIQSQFGICYHLNHVGRIIKKLSGK